MLKLIYDSEDAIPAGYEEVYTEKDGKWHLTGVEGVSATAPAGGGDAARLKRALDAERAAHGKTKTELASVKETVETITLERDELQVSVESSGKPDQAKIDEIVERRVKLATAPIERKLQAVQTDLTTKAAELEAATSREKQSTIRTALSEAAAKAGVDKMAITQAVDLISGHLEIEESTGAIISREGGRFAPGLDLTAVLDAAKTNYPNLWPASSGGGARGGDGGTLPGGSSNPYSHTGWNITGQMNLVATKGEEYARRLATSVGVNFDSPKRPPAPGSRT